MNGLKITICALLLAAAGACNQTQGPAVEVEDAEEPHNMLYGINADDYRTETGEVGSGETLGKKYSTDSACRPSRSTGWTKPRRRCPAAQHPRRAQVHGLYPRGFALRTPSRLPRL